MILLCTRCPWSLCEKSEQVLRNFEKFWRGFEKDQKEIFRLFLSHFASISGEQNFPQNLCCHFSSLVLNRVKVQEQLLMNSFWEKADGRMEGRSDTIVQQVLLLKDRVRVTGTWLFSAFFRTTPRTLVFCSNKVWICSSYFLLYVGTFLPSYWI